MPTGTLMKNAHRQLRLRHHAARRASGPAAPAAAPIAPQVATAIGTFVAREGLQHERERRRHEDGGTDRLDHLGDDEHVHGRRESAQHRSEREHDDADEEHPAPPDPVGEPAGRDQRARRTRACRR